MFLLFEGVDEQLPDNDVEDDDEVEDAFDGEGEETARRVLFLVVAQEHQLRGHHPEHHGDCEGLQYLQELPPPERLIQLALERFVREFFVIVFCAHVCV